MKKDAPKLTEGSIFKALVTLSLPIIGANILQTAYQLIDTFWVGKLGSVAVAAVSISFPIIFLIISVGVGLAMAGTILVAQFKGKEDQTAINHITAQTLLMVMLVSILLSAIGYLLSPYGIQLMGAEPAVVTSAVSYLQISFIGMIFVFTFAVYQALMRGVGDVKTPLFIVMGTVLLNLLLDPLFIFGYGIIPGYGVTGAAIATIATQGTAALVGLTFLMSGRHEMKLRWHQFKPDLTLIKRMIKIGVPASIEQSTRALGLTMMTLLVATFSTSTIAAYGIGGRILSFVIIPAMGLSMATSTLVGQNIGAGKIARAEKTVKYSSLIGFGTLTLAGIIIFFFARPLSAIFIPGETQTIDASAHFIKIMALTFGFIGIQQVVTGAFRGAGNTTIAMAISIISLWILRFPLAYILSEHAGLGSTGIWIAFPVANVIAAVITVLWFARGSWKQEGVTEDMQMTDRLTEQTIIEEGFNEA